MYLAHKVERNVYLMNIGERIRTIRKQKSISQAQLAKVLKEFYGLGTDRVAVSKWETGFQLPNVEAIRSIADYFKVSADYFIKEEYDNSSSYINSGDSLCFVAPDDSMIGAGIKMGASVFVTHTDNIPDGSIIVVSVNDKTYIRRIYQKGDVVVLAADNVAFAPLVFDCDMVSISGKVTSVYFAVQ